MLHFAMIVLFAVVPTAVSIAQEDGETASLPATTGKADNSQQVQQSVCLLVESAAQANALPVEFFVRLIWQESRFRPAAVGPMTRSGRRALGIAQFMPGTAAERNLLDPLNPVEALPKAAEFLKELRDEFGNLGLAAAAYNAGPGRVRSWLAGGASLPAETRAYVQAVTGHPVDAWAAGARAKATIETEASCPALMAKLRQPPATFLGALQQHVVMGAMQPWGAILGANRSRAEIMERYAGLQRRFAEVLAGHDPILLERSRGGLPRYQVRVGVDSREAANDICRKIHLAGGDCVVLRNPGS